jgi:hypothetical protein
VRHAGDVGAQRVQIAREHRVHQLAVKELEPSTRRLRAVAAVVLEPRDAECGLLQDGRLLVPQQIFHRHRSSPAWLRRSVP